MKKGMVLITGSSKGLGRSLALKFAKGNYHVILHGRDKEALKGIQEKLGEESDIVVGDLTLLRTLDNLVSVAKERGIDTMVNNAGVYLNRGSLDMSDEELRRIMEVDFFAPARLMLRMLPFFKKKGGGIIANVNSVAGNLGSRGESAYAAAKHALRGFSDSIKREVTRQGLKIIDFYLGDTAMTEGRKDKDLLIDPEEAADFMFCSIEACRRYARVYPKEIHLGRCRYV
jgi:short-subunit dehydrogenase